MALNLVVEPVLVSTSSADEDGRLVLADGKLVAVLVRLADEIHAGRVGSWFMEAGFGPCADTETAPPVFASLDAVLAWIGHRLAASRSLSAGPCRGKCSPANGEGAGEYETWLAVAARIMFASRRGPSKHLALECSETRP